MPFTKEQLEEAVTVAAQHMKEVAGSKEFQDGLLKQAFYMGLQATACSLIGAVKRGDIESVKKWLKKDIDKNFNVATMKYSKKGKSALDWALEKGHEDIVKLLKQHGEDK